MEKQYWEEFETSGKVEDYLHYREMHICNQVMQKYDGKNMKRVGESSIEPDNNGERYDYVRNTNGRI